MKPTEDRFKGCLLGSALGDAVGELAFRYNTKNSLYSRLEEIDELRYTDDTAMAIGLAESLIDKEGEVVQDHLGETFRKNYEKEPWRGYGQGPPKIFKMMDNGDKSYVEIARSLFCGDGSKGNGSAMRIAPVGVFFSGYDFQYDKAVETAEITHAHPLGKDGAGLLALLIGKVSTSDELEQSELALELSRRSETEEFTERFKQVSSFLEEGVDRKKAAKELGTSVLIENSVPYAVFSFLKTPDSFENALMDAVLVPGDKDTIGAMTGAISGAYLGFSTLPESWIEKLENVSYIEELAENLHGLLNKR